MLFNQAVVRMAGPPPQSLLDKRCHWRLLLLLLGLTAVMRFLTMDVIGGILEVLMLCMAGIMIQDGMAELPRYAFVFAVLCMLNLFFDAIPLVASLQGRAEVSTQPVEHRSSAGVFSMTYRTTWETTPFFDSSQGFLYNATSAAMVLSPVTMLLGAYLSIHAHLELQRTLSPLLEGDGDRPWWIPDDAAAARPLPGMRPGGLRAREPSATGQQGDAPSAAREPAGAGFTRFQGPSYRLDDS